MARFYRITLLLIVVLLASLACNLGAPRPGTPTPNVFDPDAGTDPTSPDSSGELPGGEQVEVVLTEQQLTALVDAALQSQNDPPIENPQIRLQKGQIDFTGQTVNQPIQAEVHAVMTVRVDETGQLDFELVSADLGPFPIPQAMLDEIESDMEEALRAELGSRTAGMLIEDITIADGEMTIAGRSG